MSSGFAVALGGGAARGLAHLGVLRILEENGLSPRAVAGTSIGALVGAAYACNPAINDVQPMFEGYLSSDAFADGPFGVFVATEGEEGGAGFLSNLSRMLSKGIAYSMAATRKSYIPHERFYKGVEVLLPDIDMDHTKLPFICTAADVTKVRRVSLREGPLRDAVAASCAIPGIFPPIRINDSDLVDGSWGEKVPVFAARSFGLPIVAVDVSTPVQEAEGLNRGLDMVLRANIVTAAFCNEMVLQNADLVIKPALEGVRWNDFSRADEIIELGRLAAIDALPELRRLARPSLLRRLLGG